MSRILGLVVSFALVIVAAACDSADEPALDITDGVLNGDFIIESPSDVEALQGVAEVTGDLEVDGDRDLTSLHLPLLTSVGGALKVHGSWLTSLDLPSLTSVGGQLLRSS